MDIAPHLNKNESLHPRMVCVWLKSSSQVKVHVLWYRTATQSLYKCCYLKARLEDVCDVRLILSANQSEWYFQSECCGYMIFTFHFNEEHVLFTQWKNVSNWFHIMTVVPIKAQLLVATFVKGLCRDTIALYLGMWRWIETGSVVLEEKILKLSQCIFAILLLSPLGKGWGPSRDHVKKLESSSPQDNLCQVLLKLSQ